MREDTSEEQVAIADGDGSEEEDASGRDLSVARHVFRAGVVCFSFDPRKRHGKTLSQVQRPVPGYERKMRDAVARLHQSQGGEAAVARQLGVEDSPEVISTDLEWHPTNVAIEGRREPRETPRRESSERARDEDDRRGRRERSVADRRSTIRDTRGTWIRLDLPRTPGGRRRDDVESSRRVRDGASPSRHPSRDISRWSCVHRSDARGSDRRVRRRHRERVARRDGEDRRRSSSIKASETRNYETSSTPS